MSGVRVPHIDHQVPPPVLRHKLVGMPVSSAIVSRWNNDLLFLSEYNAHPVISTKGLPFTTAGAASVATYKCTYRKSVGVHVLRVAIEVNTASTGNGALTCAVTTSAGSVAWVESSSVPVLDGTHNIHATNAILQDYGSYVGHLDVSALTNGTYYDLIFTVTDVLAGVTRGLYGIDVTEVPLGDVTPLSAPTTELGADQTWLLSNDFNRIENGATTTARGMTRLYAQLETARYQRPRCWQIIAPEDTAAAYAWRTTSTVANTAWPYASFAATTFRLRTRAVWGTGASDVNTYLARIRYRTSTTQQPKFSFVVTPVGGTPATTTFTLLHSSGAWTGTTTDSAAANMVVTLPTKGTNQEVDITLELWNGSAGTVYVSNLCIYENES